MKDYILLILCILAIVTASFNLGRNYQKNKDVKAQGEPKLSSSCTMVLGDLNDFKVETRIAIDDLNKKIEQLKPK